ncbi:UDP-N-acetylmuramoyl-L-alanine--D-glutamate ligase [Patescibacteria group bacterium]|nr:UDP-N-acetylmuramoyl-L-alanine--D-glutamate ligase [Patescibacteria group bacterium]
MNPKIKPYIQTIKNQNIHVLGASGTEGAAVTAFLYDNHIQNITAHDFQPDLTTFRKQFRLTHPTLTAKQRVKVLNKIINPKIKLNLKKDYLQDILDADIIFLPQAWYLYPFNSPAIHRAIKQKINISSLTKLYFDLAPCPIIGITGSQGKSTTTTLITRILKSTSTQIYTSGNIRGIFPQILPNIDKISPKDIIVLEISNRQLTIDLKQSPHISVITTISPNHIEEHGSYQKYINIKKSILKYQTQKDYVILNYDNSASKKWNKDTSAKPIFFGITSKTKTQVWSDKHFIYLNQKPLIKIDQLKIFGPHNISNIMAAIAATIPLKIPANKLTKAIYNFSGIPHRLEHIKTINQVKYIDDLKSTTPTATITAINSFANKNIHLIIGGYHKNVSHRKLAQIINQKVTTLFTMPGTTSDETIAKLKSLKSRVKIYQFPDIFQLIKKVKSISQPGDIVLLSPAGAYFQREHLHNKYSFKKLLKKL